MDSILKKKENDLMHKIAEIKLLKENLKANFLQEDIHKIINELDDLNNEIKNKIDEYFGKVTRKINYDQYELNNMLNKIDLNLIENKLKQLKDLNDDKLNIINNISNELNIVPIFLNKITNHKRLVKLIDSSCQIMISNLPSMKQNIDYIGNCIRTIDTNTNEITHVEELINGDFITCSIDNTIKFWSPDWLSCEYTQSVEYKIDCLFVMNKNEILTGCSNGYIIVWCLNNIKKYRRNFIHHKSNVTCILNYDSFNLLSASADGLIRLWNLKTGNVKRTYRSHLDSINCITLYELNKNVLVLSGSNDGEIHIWDPIKEISLKILNNGCNVLSLEVVNKLNILISSSIEKVIKLWDLKEFICFRILEGHNSPIFGIKLIHDDRLISYTFDKIKLWDLNTTECLDTCSDQFDQINCLKVLKNGEILVASKDKKIRIFF